MTHFPVIWIVAAALVGLLAGCNVDKQYTWDYGRAYHAVVENQKLNPEAGDDSPVVGENARVAAAAQKRYEEAAPPKEEKKSPVLVEFGNK
jgi:hypothetical protein